MKIGELIREYRKKNGLSLKELGEIIDLTPQAISQYERGLRGVNLDTLIRIMDILNISPEDLPNNIKEKYFKNINTLLDIKKLSIEYNHIDSIQNIFKTIFKYNICCEDKTVDYPSTNKDDDIWVYVTNLTTKRTKKLNFDEFMDFMTSVRKFMDFEFSNL